jgi:Domain of unknown function (DUF4430)
VYRRSLFAAVLAALVLVPSAFAARVHVRVEGKTQTIFGTSEPTLNVTATALDALEAASFAGEFYYHVAQTGLGRYVDQIGRYPASGSSGWVFKVNGIAPPVGADQVKVKDGDTVLWYWATFSGPAGPLTLEVETSIAGGKRCFYATGRNDAGRASRMRGVVFTLNGRSVRSSSGVVCTRLGRYTVKVSKSGAIRSRTYSGR